MYTHNNPRLAVEAERLADECATCQVLKTFGPESEEARKAISKRLGYELRGEKWIQFLRDHEAYHLNKGGRFPMEWSADVISTERLQAIYDAAKPKPRPVSKPLTEEERAYLEFQRFARPEVRQVNKRGDNKPIVKPLDQGNFKF